MVSFFSNVTARVAEYRLLYTLHPTFLAVHLALQFVGFADAEAEIAMTFAAAIYC